MLSSWNLETEKLLGDIAKTRRPLKDEAKQPDVFARAKPGARWTGNALKIYVRHLSLWPQLSFLCLHYYVLSFPWWWKVGVLQVYSMVQCAAMRILYSFLRLSSWPVLTFCWWHVFTDILLLMEWLLTQLKVHIAYIQILSYYYMIWKLSRLLLK